MAMSCIYHAIIAIFVQNVVSYWSKIVSIELKAMLETCDKREKQD